MAPTLAGSALWYCERGLMVFPLRAGTKIPATKNGFHDASMSVDTVRAWWTKYPTANIGLPTGHLFDVIDIDGEAGIDSMVTMEAQIKIPNTIGVVATPRGYHMYIRPTGDGCATGFRPGLDYRGIGGYVVAPPSTVERTVYRWLDPLTLTD